MSMMANNKVSGPVNYLSNGSVNHLDSTTTELPLWKSIFAHLDWLLMGACVLTLIWFLFVIVNSVVRRRYGDLRKLRTKANQDTNWRFNNNRTTSSNQIVEAPFQSKMCVNYYGGSYGCDSEHDMIQSSQSSHYEEFTQQRLMSQQPVCFNALGVATHSTLDRRPLDYRASLTLTSNVPIINGTHSSRINLEQRQRSKLRNEHIYDDIIYNQMHL